MYSQFSLCHSDSCQLNRHFALLWCMNLYKDIIRQWVYALVVFDTQIVFLSLVITSSLKLQQFLNHFKMRLIKIIG